MEKFAQQDILKMDSKKLENILRENPDIREDAEFFIIDIKKDGEVVESHYIPKRNYIEFKTKEMKEPERINIEKVIEAIKKYPGESLDKALNLLKK